MDERKESKLQLILQKLPWNDGKRAFRLSVIVLVAIILIWTFLLYVSLPPRRTVVVKDPQFSFSPESLPDIEAAAQRLSDEHDIHVVVITLPGTGLDESENKRAADQAFKEYCNPGFLRDRSGICLLLFPNVGYVDAAVFTYGMARGSVNFDLEKEVDHLFYQLHAPSPEFNKASSSSLDLINEKGHFHIGVLRLMIVCLLLPLLLAAYVCMRAIRRKKIKPSPESYKYRVTRNYINRTDTFRDTD